MDSKRLSRIEIKDEARGEVRAVFSTFNVIDSDRDVTLPGAFEDGKTVPISAYGHTSWEGALPVGTGVISQTAKEARLDGQFLMDTTHGRDAFLTVKALADKGLGEWSYGYDPLEYSFGEHDGQKVRFLAKVKTHEVSPVLLGAGVNTRTLSAKALIEGGLRPEDLGLVSYKAAIRPHHTEVTARGWDGVEVVKAIDTSSSVSDMRSVFAWVDSNGDPESKTSYRFPHHHGVGGPANLRALWTHIATLNSGKASIPDADRQAVYNHLADHLRDADREPPELRAANAPAKNIDRLLSVISDLSGIVDEIALVSSGRAERGKSLSALTVEALGWADDDLRALQLHVRRLLDSPADAMRREYARFVQLTHPQGA